LHIPLEKQMSWTDCLLHSFKYVLVLSQWLMFKGKLSGEDLLLWLLFIFGSVLDILEFITGKLN